MSTTSIKAIVTPAQLAGPVSPEEAQSQVEKLQATLPEIDQAKKWIEEYGDFNDLAEVEILEAKIKSSLALLENYLATGQWEAPAGSGAAGADGATNPAAEMLYTLNPGWNGAVTLRSDNLPPGYEASAAVEPGAEFQGLVYINNSNNPEAPAKVIFQASPTATDIKAYNRGDDIVYMETYLDESGAEKKRFWIGVGHAKNSKAEIVVDAHKLDHGIQMDFSKTLRLGENGTTAGFSFVASDHDDQIYGSQGKDKIVGLKGSDKLFGMGGDDEMYGDDSAEFAQVRQSLGLPTDIPDGDDTIDEGEGKGAVEGGGGFNYGFKTDEASKTGVHHELGSEGDALDRSAWLGDGTLGFEVQEEGEGFAVLKEADYASRRALELKIPEGYSMAYAANEGTSLKITFVKEGGAGQPPKTFVVTVKGALDDRTDSLLAPFTLILSGNGEDNIVDFHGIEKFGNNNFRTRDMQESDMVIPPLDMLTQEGLTFDDLQTTSLSMGGAQSYVERVIPETGEDEAQPWIEAKLNGEKEIEVSLKEGVEVAEGGRKTLRIDKADFEKAYTFVDPDSPGDLLVVLVKPGVEEGSKETLVIRVKDYAQFRLPSEVPAQIFNWLFLEAVPLWPVPFENIPNYRANDVG